eukprot:m51a1_g11449 putative twinfilin-1 isoform x2 (346) ;mRNA; f:11712-13332
MASHSSGIPISASLRDAFMDAHRTGSKRAIKVRIVNDEIAPVGEQAPSGSFEDDLDKVVALLEPKEACYLLVRTDDSNDNGARWVLDCYVPDACPVRDKMLYASSRATLKLSLGGGMFAHDLFGTVRADFNKAGFGAYLRMQKSAAPLTESEQAREFESHASSFEASASVAARGKSPTAMVHGVSFGADPDARRAVEDLVAGKADNYVQLSIDEDRELIILNERSKATLEGLSGRVPLDRPAFHFLRYDHEHEGERLQSVLYVYSCPDGSGNTRSAPVKARMLFSSCKGCVEALAGRVDLRMEINDGSEVGAQAVLHKLHPPPVEKKEAFARPKPAGKGPKRLIR